MTHCLCIENEWMNRMRAAYCQGNIHGKGWFEFMLHEWYINKPSYNNVFVILQWLRERTFYVYTASDMNYLVPILRNHTSADINDVFYLRWTPSAGTNHILNTKMLFVCLWDKHWKTTAASVSWLGKSLSYKINSLIFLWFGFEIRTRCAPNQWNVMTDVYFLWTF